MPVPLSLIETLISRKEKPFDLSVFSYSGNNFTLNRDSNHGFEWKPDGSLLIAGDDNRYFDRYFFEYTASTPFDLNTLTFTDKTSSQGQTQDPTFKPDGSKVFYVFVDFSGSFIVKVDLSTPWDIENISSLDSVELPFDSLRSLKFSEDGSYLFTVDNSSGELKKFTPDAGDYDISNGITEQQSFDLSNVNQESGADGLWLLDSKTIIVTGNDNARLYQIELTADWDLSTALYGGKSLDVSGQMSNPQCTQVRNDGNALWVEDTGSPRTIYEYTR